MKHLVSFALFTVGSLALGQFGPRRLMDPAAKRAPKLEDRNDNVKEYFFNVDFDHFDNSGKSD